ncbi:MAG: TIGR02466 family protein [Xanthomonadales bacterium]|nr:TIGR02466 family protein [Xanthomonadales bacterium]
MALEFDPRTNVQAIFPTPLGKFEVPNARELMPRIAEAILARERQEQGVSGSNRGGWHSEGKLLSWPELEFANLGELFRESVAHMLSATTGHRRFNLDLHLAAWANVNRPGAFNTMHIHPNNHWSGVLYVQTPDLSDDPVPKAGNIEFQDPRGPINMVKPPGSMSALSIPPQQGTMLVFPSWLFHGVSPFTKDVVRISIAFNARIDRFIPADDPSA